MSTRDTDYSNTIIYKITCKDPNIHDVYVGHTVNFVQRKQSHRITCINTKSLGYNCKVYRVIRNNGGWDNWDMCIIAFYNCKDVHEARQKEQEHFVALNATLNSVEPFPSKPVRTIRIIKPVRPVRPVRHVRPVRPVRPVRQNKSTYNENMPISAFNRPNVCYNCEPCGFTTDNKTDYERHLSRKKHIAKCVSPPEHPSCVSNTYTCPSCSKSFKCRTSIYKHKAICKEAETTSDSTAATVTAASSATATTSSDQYLREVIIKNQELTSAMMILIQQNTEFQSKMMELFINNTGTSQRHTRDNET